VTVATYAGARQRRSFHTDESEEAMRTDWPAYVAAEAKRIAADEEAFKRLVDLFKQTCGWHPRVTARLTSGEQRWTMPALTTTGFEGRAGFQYNYDLCLMVEYGPRAIAGRR
jgi:hypothetical protein